ncbi:hypothetical protein GGX14DRAFT_364698 [Mycena pura]|uniref:Uncharacterized protein n=1 Tax=Mycena pura TaxID=153505 RepID=A0AAD6YF27_9AGAR|nr:hypothetical protein GGX14DRAFT_364698 [Mycena pura]
MSRLSATNLAAYHHFTCDLYLYNVYHYRGVARNADLPELSKANLERGLDWEQSCLFPFLDRGDLLLTVPSTPIDGNALSANIEADDRDHFFVAGITFWPPPELKQRFLSAGSDPVDFGLAKPDLLEITRTATGIVWKVIDAKSSKAVKTSHHVQIYFYTLCLSYLLPKPFFRPAGTAAIWLPPANGFDSDTIPSVDDIKSIDISLLTPSLDDFLFRRLPKILFRPRDSVNWHLNPLCRGCPFETDCTKKTIQNGELGSMPNISLGQVETIRTLLGISRGFGATGTADTDIEDLHLLFGDVNKLRKIEHSYPSTLKKVKRILAIQRNSLASPVLEAARTRKVQVIPRRNFTCPRREDIAVVISIIVDPSSSKQRIAFFCISVFSYIPSFHREPVHGPEAIFVTTLSSIIGDILSLNNTVNPAPLTQFYVFSAGEEAAIQALLVDTALTSAPVFLQDVRQCIGALVQGASLLQTTFQPLLLSGALLAFMTKGQLKINGPALKMLLQRMSLSTSGTPEDCRQRIQDKINDLQTESGRAAGTDDRRTEMGQLPRVVILKKEIASLLALPVPGFWDLAECASTFLPPGSLDRKCPSDEDVYDTYRNNPNLEALEEKLEQRNSSMYAVLQNMRSRIALSGSTILVNGAKMLTTSFLDVCQEPNLRKLFFMQQFEVLAKLSELWKARIEGCPDAPILEYKEPIRGPNELEHTFYLISGSLDMPGGVRDKAFYNYIMTEDQTDPNSVPTEALFDDLSVCGLLFPLNKYTRSRWNAQNPVVQRELRIADLRDITIDQQRTKVTVRTWGGDVPLVAGRHYRLSPRLVDFNTIKILATLLELDIRTATDLDSAGVAFLRLILDPRSFSDNPEFRESGKQLVKVESNIQNMFRNLKDLNDLGGVAGALVLKPSQHRAVQRILSSRLSVLWGPPVRTAMLRSLTNFIECRALGKRIQLPWLYSAFLRFSTGLVTQSGRSSLSQP